jgi:hypothetical protein
MGRMTTIRGGDTCLCSSQKIGLFLCYAPLDSKIVVFFIGAAIRPIRYLTNRNFEYIEPNSLELGYTIPARVWNKFSGEGV